MDIPHILRQDDAVPGTRLVHLRAGWKATLVRVEWPVLYIHFDSDVLRGRREERRVWARIFGVLEAPGDDDGRKEVL